MVREYLLAHPDYQKSQVVDYFKSLKFARSSVYRIINRFQAGGDSERRIGSGKKAAGLDERKRKQIKKDAEGRVEISYRGLGKKHGYHKNTIKKVLNEQNVFLRKRREAPYASQQQKDRQKRCLRKLRDGFFRASNDHISVIMDDESYFDQNGMDFQGNKFYFTMDGKPIPDDVKFKQKTKFPFKVLVWCAISEKGRSNVYIHRSKGAINSDTYISILEKYLLKFIREHHSDGNYIFWPDLASSHYSEKTVSWMREKEISFLPKQVNPPNVPQLRPIERFWYFLKDKVYTKGWKPKNIEDLRKRITKLMREFRQEECERLMRNVHKKVRKAANDGVLSVV